MISAWATEACKPSGSFLFSFTEGKKKKQKYKLTKSANICACEEVKKLY